MKKFRSKYQKFYCKTVENKLVYNKARKANWKMARQEDKKKRKNCSLCADKVTSIDYKDAAKLKRYLTEAGKIIPRRITGNCAAHQRMIAKAIKKAREAAIINYVFD